MPGIFSFGDVLGIAEYVLGASVGKRQCNGITVPLSCSPRHSRICAIAGTKKELKEDSSRPATRRSTRLKGHQHQGPPDESLDLQEPNVSDERKESPPWTGIDLSQLPEDNVNSNSDSESSSGEPHADSDSDPTLSDLEAGPQALSFRATNARSPRWQSWQDRYLIQAVDQTRPFLLPPSEREEGWNRTSEILLRDSSAVGPRSIVDRTGSACKSRFMKLMKEHKKGETESRMKTGAVEEVSEHINLMTELQAIMDDHQGSAKDSSAKSKRKADVEEQAGQQLRDAAMKGLARREGLIDVSELDGASVRERQGQRKRARPPLSPSKHHNRPRSSDDYDLDVEPLPKRRRTRNHIPRTQRLMDAQRRADQQHGEILHAQNESLRALVNLTTEIKGLTEDTRAARDAGETSCTAEILAEIVAKKI
ncbi:hypothetical protein B0H19DRAFT_1202092 [Mycena capillaripes]|nr:hypothetical protein B0H19DRAFT_1202092 [Mycena capillaripes]